MKIQNKNLAGSRITLRFTSKDGDRVVVQGDERGVFDLPQKDADFLLSTPGWSQLREASPLEDPAPSPAGPPPAPKPPLRPVAPGPPAAVPATPAQPSPPAPAEEPVDAAQALKAEVTALRSKADALAFAELHGVEGVTAEMRLSELKEKIESELLEAADPEEG